MVGAFRMERDATLTVLVTYATAEDWYNASTVKVMVALLLSFYKVRLCGTPNFLQTKYR
jgi:hypothetical protein